MPPPVPTPASPGRPPCFRRRTRAAVVTAVTHRPSFSLCDVGPRGNGVSAGWREEIEVAHRSAAQDTATRTPYVIHLPVVYTEILPTFAVATREVYTEE